MNRTVRVCVSDGTFEGRSLNARSFGGSCGLFFPQKNYSVGCTLSLLFRSAYSEPRNERGRAGIRLDPAGVGRR